jgi:hypothetical protein
VNGFILCDIEVNAERGKHVMQVKMKSKKHAVDFRHAPPSRWTCIARPDDTYKTLVREDGALLYRYMQPTRAGRLSGAFHAEVDFGLLASAPPLEITQDNDDPGNSIVVTTLRYAFATLTLRACGYADEHGRRTDVVLWRIEATPHAKQFVACLAVSPVYHPFRSAKVDGVSATDPVVLEQAPDEVSPPRGLPLVIALSPGSYRRSADPMDWYNFAAAFRIPPAGALSRMALLDEGDILEGAVMIPQGHDAVQHLDYDWARNALTSERAFWKRQRIPRIGILVADPDIQKMIHACARNILQAREVHDGLPEFQVGPTCYRNLWVVDGYYLLQMARYLGLPVDAERGTRALLRRVQPDGSIRDIPEHTMETMISVATLVRQAELAGAPAMFAEQWPVVMNAIRYIRTLREQAKTGDSSSPEYGLMPKAYADGGVGGVRAEYLTTLWTLAGLKLAANVARQFGREDDARAIQNDVDELMVDFRAHARRDLRTLPDGTPYLRMWMGGQSDHVINPDYKGKIVPWQKLGLTSGAWAFCQSIYTGEIFPSDDPLVQNLLNLFDQLDDQQGIPEGMGWLLDRSVWPYGGAFAAQVWLYAGHPDKAVDYLYAFANHAAPTRVWREEQSLDFTGHGHANGDMPHNWASAEFIHLVRNLLVVERNMTLELLSGLPSAWCRPGNRNCLEKTPTRFGPVTVDCRISKNRKGVITVIMDPKWKLKPTAILVKLPFGARSNSVSVNGKNVTPGKGSVIHLPPSERTKGKFRITFQETV